MQIRSLTPSADADLSRKLVVLQRQAYAVEAALIGDSRIPPLLEDVDDVRRAPLEWLGAWFGNADDEGGGRLVAAVAWTEERVVLEIDRLMVAPCAHRRGAGSALVREVLQRADPRPTVVSTGRDNHPARGLYLRLGFRPTGDEEVLPGLWVTHFEHRPRTSS